MSDVLPAVPLHSPVDCTTYALGHHLHPIQVKAARGGYEPDGIAPDLEIGRLDRTTDGLVFTPDDGDPSLVATHSPAILHRALAELGPDGWRHAKGVLWKGRMGASVVRDEPLGLCRPRRAADARRLFRVGEPRSGGPVRRQRWICDTSWGQGRTLGSPGWAGGLAAKLADLTTRGTHQIRVSALDGTTSWAINVTTDTLTVIHDGLPIGCAPIDDALAVATHIRDHLDEHRRIPLEIDITPLRDAEGNITTRDGYLWIVEDTFDDIPVEARSDVDPPAAPDA